MLSLYDDLAVPSVGLTRSRINTIMIYAMLAAMPELEKDSPERGGKGQWVENRNIGRLRTRVEYKMRMSDIETSFIASSGYSLWTHEMEGRGPGFVVVMEREGQGNVECLLYMGELSRASLSYFLQL